MADPSALIDRVQTVLNTYKTTRHEDLKAGEAINGGNQIADQQLVPAVEQLLRCLNGMD